MLKMPRGMSLDKLTFGHVLAASDLIIKNASALKVRFQPLLRGEGVVGTDLVHKGFALEN